MSERTRELIAAGRDSLDRANAAIEASRDQVRSGQERLRRSQERCGRRTLSGPPSKPQQIVLLL